MLRMAVARLPKGCAKHSGQSPDVKAMPPFPHDFGNVALFPEFGESDGLEAQRGRCANGKLAVDLGGQLAGGLAVGPHPRAAALAVLVVA